MNAASGQHHTRVTRQMERTAYERMHIAPPMGTVLCPGDCTLSDQVTTRHGFFDPSSDAVDRRMMMMWCLVAAFVVAPCLGFLSQDALRADVSSRLTTAQLKSHDIGDLLATVHAATLLGVSMPNGVCAALKKRDERTIVLARTAALAGCEPLPAIKNPDNVEVVPSHHVVCHTVPDSCLPLQEVYHSAMVALRSEAFPGLVAKLKGATSDRDTALLLDAAASVATKHPEVVKTADFKTFVTSLERAVTTIFRSGSFQ